VENTRQEVSDGARVSPPVLPVLAPALMMVFWMLLGAAAGIKVMQSLWHLLGFGGGEMSIAVPVGGVVGALVGLSLGLIRNPKVLVLVMAAFAGSAAGGVAGQLPWGDVGAIGGQVAGGLVGGLAWAAWLFFGRGKEANLGATPIQPVEIGYRGVQSSRPSRARLGPTHPLERGIENESAGPE
jgi:hypothetical protein